MAHGYPLLSWQLLHQLQDHIKLCLASIVANIDHDRDQTAHLQQHSSRKTLATGIHEVMVHK